MNNFIKQNWFKIIIATAILIVALSIGYYFTVLNAQKIKISSDEEARNWQIKCENYGNDKYGDTLEFAGSFQTSRRYYFSKSLNTCIMYVQTNDSESGRETKDLLDMYKQENIYGYNSDCRPDSLTFDEKNCLPLYKFEQKRKEILGF